MIRLTVLYGTPNDEASFLSHYEGTHVPIVHRMEKLERFTWGKGLPGPDGSAPPYFLNAELCWASPEDMQADMGGKAGEEAVADLANLPCEGVTMLVSEGR